MVGRKMPFFVVATAPTDRFDRRVTTATRSRSPLRLGGVRSTAARSRKKLSRREDMVHVQSGTSLQAAAQARAALPASRSS